MTELTFGPKARLKYLVEIGQSCQLSPEEMQEFRALYALLRTTGVPTLEQTGVAFGAWIDFLLRNVVNARGYNIDQD